MVRTRSQASDKIGHVSQPIGNWKETRPGTSREASRTDPVTQPARKLSKTAAESVSPSQLGTTKAGKTRHRMQWTHEMNVAIMRSFYEITIPNPDTPYRKTLYEKFKEQYPRINVTEQRIADQKRTIGKNKLISATNYGKLRIM